MQPTRHLRIILLLVPLALTAGCSPQSAIKYGVKLADAAVDRIEVKDLEAKLMGKPPSASDQLLGDRVDTLRQVGGSRQFLIYRVSLDVDVLTQHRYLVEVADNRIVAVAKLEKKGQTKLDIARALVMEQKAKGKSPKECQQIIDRGRPVLEVRSDNTKVLRQLYEARIVEEAGEPYYCVVFFDKQDRCTELAFVSAEASTRKDLAR
jgi:hypothetical protein